MSWAAPTATTTAWSFTALIAEALALAICSSAAAKRRVIEDAMSAFAAAAAVAAHECGHAVQHAVAYPWLQMRSKMVPAVQVASGLSQWVIMGGLVLSATTALGSGLLLAGIVLYGIVTAFTFITLPVEYDASNRALAWLKRKQIVGQEEYAGAEDALKWAARTYVVAAIGALATLAYFVLRYLGSRD